MAGVQPRAVLARSRGVARPRGCAARPRGCEARGHAFARPAGHAVARLRGRPRGRAVAIMMQLSLVAGRLVRHSLCCSSAVMIR